MSARRPLQPLSPLSANIVGAGLRYSSVTKIGTHDGDNLSTMDGQAQDDNTQDYESVVSGLTSLGSGDDDIDRLIIQNARDEKRMRDAQRGSLRPFTKARTHPRVGLTLDNLERNDTHHIGGTDQHMSKRVSPPSSSGSTRSDPPVRAPKEWGRKGRVQRNWLRTITSDEQRQPVMQEDTLNGLVEDLTPGGGVRNDDVPLPSIEDSPLSHKGSLRNTPASSRRRDANLQEESEWDLSIDFNEASMIASTPYVPRSQVLDDIRQREIDSLREQAVTTSRLDRIRENSPEESRRPRSSSRNSPFTQPNEGTTTEQEIQGLATSELRLRRRTNSWKTIGKSQVVTGQGGQQPTISPVTVYKTSSETVDLVDSGVDATARSTSKRPVHRREDSHELLRRLARVSNTPSPGRAARPQTAPARQVDSASSGSLGVEGLIPTEKSTQLNESAPAPAPIIIDDLLSNQGTPSTQQEPRIEDQRRNSMPAQRSQYTMGDVDSTPMPVERSILNAKTPQVTGGWIDTPAPRTAPRPDLSRATPGSPERGNSSTPRPVDQVVLPETETRSGAITEAPPERTRPTLPGSALEAIVEEAKANGGRALNQDSLGDSTIDSLEDLIRPNADHASPIEPEEDTLLDLQLPTGPPRNEAERRRQQELAQLHKMNQRLRAARTSIRDASRGMRRVESRVEHVEHIEENGEVIRVIYRDCPCISQGHHSLWASCKRLFRDPKIQKRAGLTWLSIFLITFLTWFMMESIACDRYCHKLYASSMIGYGVDVNAPRFPFVVPTLLYRWTIEPWWLPLWAIISWMGQTTYRAVFEEDIASTSITTTAQRFATSVMRQAHSTETIEPDFSMDDDEII